MGCGGGTYVTHENCKSFFERNRKSFDEFLTRRVRGERGTLASGAGLPANFRSSDVKEVEASDVELRVELFNGAIHPARCFVYLEAGVASLDSEVTTDRRWQGGYYVYIPLDEYWYYYEWDE